MKKIKFAAQFIWYSLTSSEFRTHITSEIRMARVEVQDKKRSAIMRLKELDAQIKEINDSYQEIGRFVSEKRKELGL